MLFCVVLQLHFVAGLENFARHEYSISALQAADDLRATVCARAQLYGFYRDFNRRIRTGRDRDSRRISVAANGIVGQCQRVADNLRV